MSFSQKIYNKRARSCSVKVDTLGSRQFDTKVCHEGVVNSVFDVAGSQSLNDHEFGSVNCHVVESQKNCQQVKNV